MLPVDLRRLEPEGWEEGTFSYLVVRLVIYKIVLLPHSHGIQGCLQPNTFKIQ